MLGVADQSALCDLEDEALEGKLCVLSGGTDVSGQGEVGELGEGDVNGEGEVSRDVSGCGEDGGEEFAGELTVEAGLFCEGDELVWSDEAALGMLPAGEGFEAAEQAGAQLDERLEIWQDLVIFECPAQIICVVVGHGRDDTTSDRSWSVNFRSVEGV